MGGRSSCFSFLRSPCCCCCCCCSCSSNRSRRSGKRCCKQRSKRIDPQSRFTLLVKDVAGTAWNIEEATEELTVGEVLTLLRPRDIRFRTHRVKFVMGSKVLQDMDTLEESGVTPGACLVAVFLDLKTAVLVIGGGSAGRAAVEELSKRFADQTIILVDAQEYFEHACGVLRAYADPTVWDSIARPFSEAVSCYGNVQFIQGEVMRLRPHSARVVPVPDGGPSFTIRFEYCIVATGCDFAPGKTWEGLPWKPRSLASNMCKSLIGLPDERTYQGRQAMVLVEGQRLRDLHAQGGSILVVGADFHSVQWVCELKHHFPRLRVTLIDSLPRCLGTLPKAAATYAERYMRAQGIVTKYGVEYNPGCDKFWESLGQPGKVDATYIMTGLGSRNKFMPASTVSARGPGGSGGWIVTNMRLQVCVAASGDRPGHVWAGGRIFAVGDCQYGAVKATKKSNTASDSNNAQFSIPPVPKTALAAVSWARLASRNAAAMRRGRHLEQASWPPEAGIIAVGLGQHDGVVCWKVTWVRDSGEPVLFGEAAADMKRRLTWPGNEERFLAQPGQWLATFKEGIPAGRLFTETIRSALHLSSRAWEGG